MPLKNGELSGPEIRKLIRGHNKLAQIKVPTGLDRDGLIKFLKSKKYTVDHEKKMLVDNISGGSSRGRRITLAKAKKITKPQPKSDAQKAATKAKKDEKAKVMKSKEDAIKAEGVKQGAALQRVVSKRGKAKAKPAPAPAPAPAQTSDEARREAGRARRRANQKKGDDILKELKIPTLAEYRAEIKKIAGPGNIGEMTPKIRKEVAAYVNSVIKMLSKAGEEMGGSVRDTRQHLQNDVGNVERHFGFLGEKLLKEREEQTGGSEVKLDEKFLKGLKSGTVEELKEDFEEYFEERKGDARTLEKLEKKTDAASKEKVKNIQMSMNILNLQMKAIQKEIKSRSGGSAPKPNQDEVKDLWNKVLIPELRTTYENDDKEKMKKAFNKAVGILAKHESKKGGISDSAARKRIKSLGNSSGKLIKIFARRAKINKVEYEGVDISELFN